MNLHKICPFFGCFFLKGCYNESTTQVQVLCRNGGNYE